MKGRIPFLINILEGNSVLSSRVPTTCCIGLNAQLNLCLYRVLPKKLLTEDIMAWTTPTLVEICIGLEINGYLPAEF